MNKLIVPPPVNSYLSNIIACAPDNTVIYGSGRTLVFIKPTPENEPNDIHILSNAHSSHIVSVNVNPDWREGNKYAVTMCSNDFTVKVWDVEALQRKFAFKHVPLGDGATAVAAAFSGHNRIISATSEGTVTLWRYVTGENSTFQLTTPKNTPVGITCMSVCPHAMWMVAFGLKNGPVMVTDMRKPGKVLHFLRGHSSTVLSLVWCPAPVNIFPMKPNNKVVEKRQAPDTDGIQTDTADEVKSLSAPTSPESSDDKKTNRRKQDNPKKEPRPWTDSHVLDGETRAGVGERGSEKNLDKKKKTSKAKTLSEFLDKKNISQTPTLEEWLSSHASDNTVESERTEIEPVSPDSTNIVSTLDSSNETVESSKGSSIEENPIDLSCNSSSSQGSSVIGAAAPESATKDTSGGEMVLEKDTTMNVACNPDDPQDSSVNEAVAPENTIKDTSGTEMVLEKNTTMDVAAENTPKVTSGVEMASEENAAMNVASNPDSSQPPSVNEAKNITKDTAESLKDTSGSEIVFEKDTPMDVTSNLDDTSGGEVILEENIAAGSSGGPRGPPANDAVAEQPLNGENAGEAEPEVENWRTRKPVVVEEEEPRREFLLASSARESNIYIWRAGTDGRLQTFLSLPKHNKRQTAAKKHSKSANEKEWIVLCWVTPNLLLSSTSNAELVECKLPRPLTDDRYPCSVHKQHNGFLYTISSPMVYLNEYNFLQERSVNVWTTGKDRTLLNIDLSTRRVVSRYPGWGGNMSPIVGSPLDPNRLAMAVSKNYHFFTWSLDQPHTKDIKFTAYSVNKGVITTLAWHPDIETLLAWGTEDGVVGTYEVSRKLKNPKEMKRFFSTPVHKVQWGPVDPTSNSRKLFAVCDSKIVVFDPFTDKKDSIKKELELDISVYTMGWKPDYTMLLVSSKNGEVLELNSNSEVTGKKYTPEVVQTIHWHPHAVSNDPTTSKYYKTFVSIIKHSKIYVFDWSIEAESCDKKMIKSYDNKEVKINDVAWNPHVANQLVMVDNHGIAWVYDIDGPVVSTYINPYVDAISSVIWSPLDPDYVIVATYGNLMIWKVSENPPLTPEAVQSQRSKLETKQKKEGNHLKTKDEDQPTDNRVKPKSQNYLVLPKFYPYKRNITMSDMKLLLDWKQGKMSADGGAASDILQVFGDLGNAKDIYKLSEYYFQSNGDRNKLNLLRLFRGDPTEIVQEAIEKKLVTPWIITIAPMASPQLYLEACKTYVEQLEVEPNADPLEVTTYMLITHQYQRCINYLCERQLFREALVLAKDKFGASDPLVEEILRKYGNMCTYAGNFELAACCFIALGDFHKAASVLYRRDDLSILKMAMELAALTGDEDLYSAVNLRCLDAELKQKEQIAGKPDDEPEERPKTENETAVEILLNYKKETLGLDDQTSMCVRLLADIEIADPKAVLQQVVKDMEKKAANLEGKPNGLPLYNSDQPGKEDDDDNMGKQENGDVRKLDKMRLLETQGESPCIEKPESQKKSVVNSEIKEPCMDKDQQKPAGQEDKSEESTASKIGDACAYVTKGKESPSAGKSEKNKSDEKCSQSLNKENESEKSTNSVSIRPSSTEIADTVTKSIGGKA